MALTSIPCAFLSVYTLTASPRSVVPNGSRRTEAVGRGARPPAQAVLEHSITIQPDSFMRCMFCLGN